MSQRLARRVGTICDHGLRGMTRVSGRSPTQFGQGPPRHDQLRWAPSGRSRCSGDLACAVPHCRQIDLARVEQQRQLLLRPRGLCLCVPSPPVRPGPPRDICSSPSFVASLNAGRPPTWRSPTKSREPFNAFGSACPANSDARFDRHRPFGRESWRLSHHRRTSPCADEQSRITASGREPSR